MHVTSGKEEEHAAKLRAGLAKLGPGFLATVCWWCDGTTRHNFERCTVCGKGKQYGAELGLLIGNEPAPESVVNQVLIAAEAEEEPPTASPTGPDAFDVLMVFCMLGWTLETLRDYGVL